MSLNSRLNSIIATLLFSAVPLLLTLAPPAASAEAANGGVPAKATRSASGTPDYGLCGR